MFAFAGGDGPTERARALLQAHAGRLLMYVAAGMILGGAGSAFFGAFDRGSGFLVVRWTGAVALGWIGLSIAGFAPSPAIVDRLAGRFALNLRFAPALKGSGAFASGLMWGLLPCGMVYGALFYAMLSGSAFTAVMAGFGLATTPSVTAVALGVSNFRRLAPVRNARVGVGLASWRSRPAASPRRLWRAWASVSADPISG